MTETGEFPVLLWLPGRLEKNAAMFDRNNGVFGAVDDEKGNGRDLPDVVHRAESITHQKGKGILERPADDGACDLLTGDRAVA